MSTMVYFHEGCIPPILMIWCFFWSRVDVTRLISISCWSAHCITLFYTFPVWYLFCLRQLLTSLQPFCWTLRKDTKTQHSTTKVAFGIHNDGKVIDVYNDQPHPPCRKGLLGAARGWSETVVSYFWRLTVQRFVGIHNNMYYSMYIYIYLHWYNTFIVYIFAVAYLDFFFCPIFVDSDWSWV